MRHRRLVVGAAAGGGGAWALGFGGWALLRVEARLARRAIPVLGVAPLPDGAYGETGEHVALRLAMIGDSAAAGVGAARADETPGARLAVALAERTGRRVELDVLAVSGSRSADLEAQVSRALLTPPHVAVVSVGANDTTHRVPVDQAIADQLAAVARLRAAGVRVVVGSCPDLRAVRPIPQPLRWYAGQRSRAMARAQEQRLPAAGATVVPLGTLLVERFCAESGALFCQDRFHPSSEGYRLVADELLPAVLEAVLAGEDEQRPAPA